MVPSIPPDDADYKRSRTDYASTSLGNLPCPANETRDLALEQVRKKLKEELNFVVSRKRGFLRN
jgi:hypothetical protein